FPDDAVRFLFGRADFIRQRLTTEIDRRHVRAEVKAHGPDFEEPLEGGRQDVLAGVLLHVVEASRPVDGAVHDRTGFGVRGSGFGGPVLGAGFGFWCRFYDMCDCAVILVPDLDDAEGTERAGVERLSARGGIERRAVERDDGAAAARLDALDAGVKFPKIRVGVVQAVGHRMSPRRGRMSAWPQAGARPPRSPAPPRPISRP